MDFNVLISKKATLEIEESITYYQEINKALANRFYIEVNENIEVIKRNPFIFPIKFDTFRETPLKIFPFVIVYEIIDNLIIIVDVFHTSRNPDNK